MLRPNPSELLKSSLESADLAGLGTFQEEGFAIVPQSAPMGKLLPALQQGTQRVLAGQYDTQTPPKFSNYSLQKKDSFMQVKGLHLSDKALYEGLLQEQFAREVAEITGSTRLQLLDTALWIKPGAAGVQSQIPWHRDFDYTQYFPEGIIHAWVPLHAIGPQDGPLIYLAGSHRQRQAIRALPIQEQGYLEEEWQRMQMSAATPLKAVPVVVPVGGYSVHDAHTLHGSGTHHGAEPRMAMAITLVTDKLVVDPLGYDGVQLGHLRDMHDPYRCPLLWESEPNQPTTLEK
ncbi:MAG: phytanoyl-CoA dioxygenase family protein [Bacteroidota bacterium]